MISEEDFNLIEWRLRESDWDQLEVMFNSNPHLKSMVEEESPLLIKHYNQVKESEQILEMMGRHLDEHLTHNKSLG